MQQCVFIKFIVLVNLTNMLLRLLKKSTYSEKDITGDLSVDNIICNFVLHIHLASGCILLKFYSTVSASSHKFNPIIHYTKCFPTQ